MLSGAIAALRPDVDQLARLLRPVVVHERREVGSRGEVVKYSQAAPNVAGTVNRTTGAYAAAVNRMSETERRTAGIRRNGRPRRRA
jgi:hypothetical protein